MSANAIDYKPSDFGIKQRLERKNSYGLIGGGISYVWSVEHAGKVKEFGECLTHEAAREQMKNAALKIAQDEIDSGWW